MVHAPKRVEIPQFPGGKRIAFTTSWDDGCVYDRRIVHAFNEWGIKGTFNLNSGVLTRSGPLPEESRGNLDVSEIAPLFQGHEVAIHTVTHPWLTQLDNSQIIDEVLRDRQALEDLVSYPVRGMAYPFGDWNARVVDVLRTLGIVYSRTVENDQTTFPPKEPLAWGATMHKFSKDKKAMPERFAEFVGNKWARGVFFVWGHSHEFADANRWGDLEKLFKPCAGNADVWYCTNIELFDYEAARQRLVIAANRQTAFNPSALPVTLNADGKLLDVPPGKTIRLAE